MFFFSFAIQRHHILPYALTLAAASRQFVSIYRFIAALCVHVSIPIALIPRKIPIHLNCLCSAHFKHSNMLERNADKTRIENQTTRISMLESFHKTHTAHTHKHTKHTKNPFKCLKLNCPTECCQPFFNLNWAQHLFCSLSLSQIRSECMTFRYFSVWFC